MLQQNWKSWLSAGFRLAKDKTRAHDSKIKVQQSRVVVMLWIGKAMKDRRQAISSADLQSAIATAVRKNSPECEDLVDVVVASAEPKSKSEANWTIRGIKFGKCDREKVATIVAITVAQMQQEFLLDHRENKDFAGRQRRALNVRASR